MIPIVERLTAQLREKGIDNPESLAVTKLREFGILDEHGNLTDYGQTRNEMTAGERAIDRAVQRSRRSPDDYVYDPGTNRATLRSGRIRASR